MKNILLLEDNESIIMGLKYSLEQEGFDVETAKSVSDAKNKINEKEYSIYLLDITLPDGNGFEICKLIKEKYDKPVIFLTARDEETNVVYGLDMGADDYVTKPFNPQELIARVNSLLRRYTKLGSAVEEEEENIFRVGDLEIDDNLKQVKINDQEIKLTPTEYKILKFLTENKGKVYSINQIYENIWAEDCYGAENIIAVHIRHIREKIEINPKEPKYLKVIWGVGYKIEKDV